MNDMKKRFEELESKRIPCSMKNVIWRLFSFIGNMFFNKPAPNIKTSTGLRLLNLGSGARRIPGWVNADFFRLNNIIWNRHLLPDWMIDITKPLNSETDYWDGILIEHVNEHLLYSENYKLFTEVYRVLKPGGVCRIILPDLDKYLNWESLKETEQKMSRYLSQAEAISNLTQNHQHVSVWNESLLSSVLVNVGFKEIISSEYNVSIIPEMQVDTLSHRWESLYLEARK